MSSTPDLPIDPTSAAALAKRGLRFDLVDTDDIVAFHAWIQADMRGFHNALLSDEAIPDYASGLGYRRTSGVFDDTAVDAASPVATINSWATDLTLPGAAAVTAWAISAVTVAPTHRRRGIARAMLEAELRTAAAKGLPLAMLTVTESTIYSRYGFSPAAMASDLTITTNRAKWAGPEVAGALHFVPLEQARIELPELFERVRLTDPGQIAPWPRLWDRMLKQGPDDKETARKLRAVRYDDTSGATQGYALYTVSENEADYSSHTASVSYIATATDDAYAAIWRFLLELDLVGEVKAYLRPVDEPVRWQVSDFRAVRVDQNDHLWLRILDVPTALEARSYSAAASLVIDVSDQLGFAEGRWLVSISEVGTASVTIVDDVPAGASHVAMTVNELGSLLLGGVSAAVLARAGRVHELIPASATTLDRSFRSLTAPWLSLWF